MKRIGAIICLTLLIVTMTATSVFGAPSTFSIKDTYPVDGQKSTTKENMCVKLTFSSKVGNKKSQEANKDAFKITTKSGKELPTIILYSPDDETQAMVLVDTTKLKNTDIKDDTFYYCTISKDFTDNESDTLGKDVVIKYKTLNQAQSNKIYMIMMVVMFGGMFFFMSRQAKKSMAQQQAGNEKEEAFNPYKEAKRTGKSVEEIVAQHEKEVAKRKAKEARKTANEADDEDEWEYDDNYHVKGPRPVSAGGSSYITGRKALAEAKAAEAAKRKASLSKKKKR